MKVRIDKMASVTGRVNLSREIELSNTIPAERGTVVVVEALEEKGTYGELELAGGRMARIVKGNIIAGVLGERQALRGYVGAIPSQINVGDTLHVLNLGGVIGKYSSANADYGQPLRVRVLGAALLDGKIVNIADHSIAWQNSLPQSAPIIMVSGTCMNSGKTTAVCEIIRVLSGRGYRIAGAKLTGVATQRDVLGMQDNGAIWALSFSDAGLPSTTNSDTSLVPAAKGILTALNEAKPDAIIIEFGDGIMGHYGVDLLLQDKELMSHVKSHILCANDLVAAWGGIRFLDEMGLNIDIIAGPATDNSAGIEYIETRFGKPAVNSRSGAEHLADMVEAGVFPAAAILVDQDVAAALA